MARFGQDATNYQTDPDAQHAQQRPDTPDQYVRAARPMSGGTRPLAPPVAFGRVT